MEATISHNLSNTRGNLNISCKNTSILSNSSSSLIETLILSDISFKFIIAISDHPVVSYCLLRSNQSTELLLQLKVEKNTPICSSDISSRDELVLKFKIS